MDFESMSIEYLIIVDPLLRYVRGGKYLFGILSVVGFSLLNILQKSSKPCCLQIRECC